MTTIVNHIGKTTETPVYRVGNVEGPFTRKAINRYRKDGERWKGRCKPYWVVRVMYGKSASIMQDYKFWSLEKAQAFWNSLPNW